MKEIPGALAPLRNFAAGGLTDEQELLILTLAVKRKKKRHNLFRRNALGVLDFE
jgi:hypothetical protein